MKRMSKGFTLVEIMIVVAIIGIIIAIAVPGFIRAREVSRARSCQENLTKIDGAKEQYALENNLTADDGEIAMTVLVTAVAETSYLKRTPICPSGGAYTTGAVSTDPTCDIGVNATDARLSHTLAAAAGAAS